MGICPKITESEFWSFSTKSAQSGHSQRLASTHGFLAQIADQKIARLDKPVPGVMLLQQPDRLNCSSKGRVPKQEHDTLGKAVNRLAEEGEIYDAGTGIDAI